MAVAFGDLVAANQFLVVLIGHAKRAADVVHSILIRGRVIAARGFVTHGVSVFPLRIHVAGGQAWTAFGVSFEVRNNLALAASGGCEHAVVGGHEIRRETLGIGELSALAVECGPRRVFHRGRAPG